MKLYFLFVSVVAALLLLCGQALTASKPVFQSKVVTPQTPGHAVEIDADISGAKQLYLVVTDGGNGFGCDWADWAEPRLVGKQGEKKLTELKVKSASTGWGKVQIDKNAEGAPLKIAGKDVAYGIGTHANSVIAFDLPAGYERFKARGGLDNGGTDQSSCGTGASVQFAVYTQQPAIALAKGGGPQNPSGAAAHDPENAVANLDVHENVDCGLFASEPMITNPSNIDIDHRGRVWLCEIVNYRGHRNKRPEGDRIVILEDTTGDGKADKETVFYQSPDFKSPHGVCVLATPSGKGTKALVSVGDKVIVMTDENGDDKADKQEVLFSGISGTQHDHGIHAFVFGPDGKLYFNFGNSGRQLKDKDGKPIVDAAGNQITANRKPYQEGMAFRCNLDGSEVETLGWNFRNNWMVTVDSFGTLWQSDNDDDGNQGVRINFVMEFGNYGYRDELTGAGWNQQRTGMHTEKAFRHWHQNDPGVVPNLLHTGAGSPTGISVYEGDLLPEVFQGEVIHCDAGPSVCRAYPVEKSGAGYSAQIEDILVGTRNKWFRPSDVSVAPDGSLIVADWYDPGVGGHAAGDLERGRLFRVTAKGNDGKYTVPKFDFASVDGAIEALKNPNYAVRYMAWQALNAMGDKAKGALLKLAQDPNPRYRARALWLLAKSEEKSKTALDLAAKDPSDDIRGMAVRIARQTGDYGVVLATMKGLSKDKSALVRRECAIGVRDLMQGKRSEQEVGELVDLWAQLAAQHDGQDRWYVEALGIGAALNWDACLDAWLAEVGGPEKAVGTAAGRDIVWRSRAKKTPALLAKIIQSESTTKEEKPRYFRAFDFLKGPEKDEALKGLLGL